MNFSAEELRKLAAPLAMLVALLAAGAGLIYWIEQEQRATHQQLAGAREQRNQARDRLTRIADEEKEVSDKLEVYRRLKSLHILGEEQRLEWADAMTRIRNAASCSTCATRSGASRRSRPSRASRPTSISTPAP